MGLKIEKKQPPKLTKSFRISHKADQILQEMADIHSTSQSFCIEGLLTSFGPGAIAEAKKIKAAQDTKENQ